MINKIEKLNVKSKYQEIIGNIHSLAKPYNKRLEHEFNNFKKKIGEHKTSLEDSIREYINNINKCLKEHSSCVEKLITEFCNNVESLKANYTKLDEFIEYITLLESMIPCVGWENGETHFKQIFETHEEYKKCLQSCQEITPKLTEFISELKCYSEKLVGKEVNFQPLSSGSDIIKQVLSPLESLKSDLDKFDKNIECVKKLEEIGDQIKTMKSALTKVKDNVDEGAKRYIEGLQKIEIKPNEVQSSIEKIKDMNDFVIARLKIAKHTIDFYKSLESEINNLNGVNIGDYDNNIENLESQFCKIKGKVESFETTIKSKHCEAKREIDKIKEEIKKQIQEAGKGVTCEDKILLEQDNDDPLSKVVKSICGSLEDVTKIKSFIDNSLKDNNAIKHILKFLQQILELECAIEGVPGNLIPCSIQSTTNNTSEVINSIIHNTYCNNSVKIYSVDTHDIGNNVAKK